MQRFTTHLKRMGVLSPKADRNDNTRYPNQNNRYRSDGKGLIYQSMITPQVSTLAVCDIETERCSDALEEAKSESCQRFQSQHTVVAWDSGVGYLYKTYQEKLDWRGLELLPNQAVVPFTATWFFI